MESHYRRGEQSVLDWIKHHHADFAAKELTVDIKEGNPSAASFMKFQAFTTAAVQDQRVRNRIQQALTDNLDKGQSKKDFAKVIDQEFDKAGLSRLNPSQIDNIYYTNTSLAFGAGQMGKMIEVSGDFPYWKYSATMDGKTRPDHAALHGKIFRTGDFTFWPPIGFRCRCTAIPLTARQAGQYLKTEMPSAEERQRLLTGTGNAEFLGNKQENFMKWLKKEYDKADDETKGYIDQAFETMRDEIKGLQKEALKQFFSDEFIQQTWDKFRNNDEFTKVAQALKMTTKQAYYVHAYTHEAPLYKELNGFLFGANKPINYTSDQLLTMKRLLANSLKKMSKYEGTVYRQIDLLDAHILKQYKEGASITWDGFSSSSTSAELEGFSKRRYTFIIHAKNARQIDRFANYDEKETLFTAGSKFKILRREEQGDKYIFELDEL